MAVTKRNSDPGQQTIAFARKSRRPDTGRSSAVHKGKLNAKPAKNHGLSPRVHEPDATAVPESAASDSIGEILNGTESKALLAELRKDRFESPRFHQENLSVSQKLLRQFDMIQEYGPCQGLTRIQRWNRAEKLGKKPPKHIKAVLDAAQKTPEYADEYEMSVFGKLGAN